jgi:diacylglycerol kinase family enzyme
VDTRIQHYRVRKIEINSDPAMPVMLDGVAFGDGPLSIRVRRQNLAVMAGKLAQLASEA